MNDDDRLLGSVMLPALPAQLRERTLTAARTATSERRGKERAGFGFGRLDLVWVGALLLLITCHVAVSLQVESPARGGQTACGIAVRRDREEQARLLAVRLELPSVWIDVTPPRVHEHGEDAWRALRSDPLFRGL